MNDANRGYLKAVAGWALLGGTAYVFWRYVVPWILPFVLAGFLAMILDPVVRAFERLGAPRRAAVLAAMALSGLVVLGGAAGLVALFQHEVLRLISQLPALFIAMRGWTDRLMGSLWPVEGSHPTGAESAWNAELGQVYRMAGALLQSMLARIIGIPNLLLSAALAAVAAFFLLRDKDLFRPIAAWLVPPPARGHLRGAGREIIGGTLGFLRAELLLLGTTALCTTLGLWWFGSPYALLLGLLAGLLDVVPFLGAPALLVPWSLALLLLGQPVPALELLLILAASAVVRQLLEPHLVGKGTGLHPLTALVALFVGLQVFGPMGFPVGPRSAARPTMEPARAPPAKCLTTAGPGQIRGSSPCRPGSPAPRRLAARPSARARAPCPLRPALAGPRAAGPPP